VTLEDLLGRPVEWSEAAAALAGGFREALGWEFVPESLPAARPVADRA
jgi:hypothetical protein